MTLVIGLAVAVFAIAVALRLRAAWRRAYVRACEPPVGVRQRLRRKHPQLSDAQLREVLLGLRDWFLVALAAGRRPVSMPSRIVDDAWHEFIVDTRAYREFCRHAFGRPFDHVPAEAMRSASRAQEGLRRTWRIACALDSIDPRQPTRLPRLFALDAQLAVVGGFVYLLDDVRDRPDACDASAIGCASGCGGSSASADSGCCGDGAGDGGCGGGCGGD